MSVLRFRAWPLLVVVLVMPRAAHAQFGGLNKLLDKAKAKVDSAKASVDTAQIVTDSTKAAINGATNLTRTGGKKTTTATTKTTTSGTTQPNGSKGGTPTTNPSITSTTSANTAAAGAAASTPTRTSSAQTAKSTPAAPTPPKSITMTEAVYVQFTRGFAVEKALHKATPNDAAGALNAGVTASGLSQTDYAMVRAKITVYHAFATSNTKVNTPLLTANEVAVLDAHKSDIAQLMTP